MKLSYLFRGPPGHPFHPPLTDITIGTFTFATIAAVLSQLGVAEERFAHGWWLALVVGLVTSAVTAATGWLDFFTISRGTPLKRTAWTHALTMVAALAVFALGMRVLNLVDEPTREALSPLPSEEKERAAE